MTGPSLPAALRAGADGIYTAEAATGLIIACGSWLARDDYASFITAGTSISSPGTVLAGIDWDAAIDTLSAGRLPSSGGERRVLQLAASLARDIPVRLVTPSPASTSATSACWSRPFAMSPDGGSSPDSAGRPSTAFASVRVHLPSAAHRQ